MAPLRSDLFLLTVSILVKYREIGVTILFRYGVKKKDCSCELEVIPVV